MNLSAEQFEKLLSTISTQQRRGSFATCKVSFSGTRDTETVESFLAAATVFKSVEQISDEDAIKSVPLILKEEAATWWNGVKEQISTWSDFESRVRHAFAPKRPAYQLYQNLVCIKQEEDELTEVFVAKKRALFAQLPEPHTESQQLDMIYGQIRYKIRVKMARESVITYDALLTVARGVEQLIQEKQTPEGKGKRTDTEKEAEKPTLKKKRCTFCRLPGHTIEVCLKKQRKDASASGSGTSTSKTTPAVAATGTQAPSPSLPKFSCYGCGTPGVVRSKCPNCAKTPLKQEKTEISFCSLDVKADVRPRPTIGIGIGNIVGNAYVDTCAKTSVASYSLYKCLRRLGFPFGKQNIVVTLADGMKTEREVLTVRVPISICYRVVQTTFIVFPESRESRTLLGIGFIQDARIVLDIPQKTWHFVDNPEVMYDLQDEDTEEISMAQIEATPVYYKPYIRTLLQGVELPEFISPMSITPPGDVNMRNIIENNHRRDELEPNLPQSSACVATDLQAAGSSQLGEPALPETSACETMPYRVVAIDLPSPPTKRSRAAFDGYSPRFVDFMYRDAQLQLHDATCELSPNSKQLFPSDKSNSSGDVEIGSIAVEDVTTVDG
ncbi:Retrovirus-related Pol polyprotein from transposon 17.6 [Operophtera brumata]|uniref:Retrovirus-related Pol polyprotein from transposon 17.6 n=1 Tax=Operophtera brumata TaxID=104452 RepID=A0A0L7LJ95_OPEBR|nr:Retrovirus-related Pol polyprotein from transposon 17.6 [Operophtera brumata]